MKLTDEQVRDLEYLLQDTLNEVDSFQECWRDCVEPLPGMEEKFNTAYAALDAAAKVDLGTSEEMDALARASRGHVYCETVRLWEALTEFKKTCPRS